MLRSAVWPGLSEITFDPSYQGAVLLPVLIVFGVPMHRGDREKKEWQRNCSIAVNLEDFRQFIIPLSNLSEKINKYKLDKYKFHVLAMRHWFLDYQ